MATKNLYEDEFDLYRKPIGRPVGTTTQPAQAIVPTPFLPQPVIEAPQLTPTPSPAGGGADVPILGATGQPATGGEGGDAAMYSPALEKLKHSYLMKDWFATPDYAKKMAGYADVLAKPTTVPIGLSERERQGIYNLGRRQIQGTTETAMEQMREKMGQSGFRAGSSGVADAALARIASGGAEQLGRFGSEIALKEAQDRFGQGMALEGLNLEKMMGAGNLLASMGGLEQSQLGMGLQSLQTAGGLEQFMKQLEEQRAARAQSASLAGSEMDFARQKFGYGQEMDALQLYLQLAGYGQQGQQSAWDPYYRGVVSGYGGY